MINRKEVSARFVKVFDQLRIDFPSDSKTRFASHMGTQLNVLNDILKGDRDITIEQLDKLIKKYRLNKKFFYANEPELYRVQPSEVLDEKVEHSNVGKRYKFIRESLGLTQEEIAVTVGLEQSHWSQIESGITFATDRVKVALNEFYDIRFEYMFTGKLPLQLNRFQVQDDMSELTKQVGMAVAFVKNKIKNIPATGDVRVIKMSDILKTA